MTGLSIVIASEARQSSFLHKKCLWRLCSKREQLLFLQLSRPVNSSEMDRRAALAMTGLVTGRGFVIASAARQSK